MNYDGIWLFGLSGVGKTFGSSYINTKIKKSFIIDGDQVRSYISFDVGYDVDSRLIQLNRLLGLSKLALLNKYFPICSSVYMTEDIQKELFMNNILLVKIERDISNIKMNNPTYLNTKNVVGVDIKYPKISHKTIINLGGNKFCKDLDQILI